MSSLGSGTAKLMTGRVISMAIGFGTAPVISRLFTPEHLGLAGMLESVMMWVAAFACLGYAGSIPLANSRTETRSIIRLCLLLSLVLLVPVLLLSLLGGDYFSDILGKPGLKLLFWIVPIQFFLTCLTKMSLFALSKERKYGWMAVAESSMAAIARPVQIGLGWALGGSALFIVLGGAAGNLIGAVVAACVLLPIFWKKNDDADPQEHTLAAVAKRHQQFPKAHMWHAVLLMGSLAAAGTSDGRHVWRGIVGYYNWSRKLLLLPMTVLGTSISRVFYPEAVLEWRERRTVSGSFETMARVLMSTCVFPIVAVALFGPLVFETTLGGKWSEAGVYSQLMAPYFLLSLIVIPASQIFLLRGRASHLVVYSVTLVVLRVMALVVGKWLGSPRAGIFLFVVASVVVLLPQLFHAMRWGEIRRPPLVRLVVREVLWASAALVPFALIHYGIGAPNLAMILLRVSGALPSHLMSVLANLRLLPIVLTSLHGVVGFVLLAVLGFSAIGHYALLIYREPHARQWVRANLGRSLGGKQD